MTVTTHNESELDRAAGELLKAAGHRRHIALEGEMGAGKTTLAAAIGRVLGVTDDVSSPTFSIINEYECAGGERIYHFDFYRISSEAEAAELGLEDYFDSGALCLMEWSGNVERYLPDDTATLRIEVLPGGARRFTLN